MFHGNLGNFDSHTTELSDILLASKEGQGVFGTGGGRCTVFHAGSAALCLIVSLSDFDHSGVNADKMDALPFGLRMLEAEGEMTFCFHERFLRVKQQSSPVFGL